MRTPLKPGGYGIHTTGLNVYSDDETIDHSNTVLFRRKDFEGISQRLAAKAHRLVALSFEPGEGLSDNDIDVPPFAEQASLKIALLGFATTSFGLIVHRGRDAIVST